MPLDLGDCKGNSLEAGVLAGVIDRCHNNVRNILLHYFVSGFPRFLEFSSS